MDAPVRLGEPWSLADLARIARRDALLELGPDARVRMERANAFVRQLADAGKDAPNVYGVNTGFGALAETRVAPDQVRTLQRNLIRSHACGIGAPLAAPIVRAVTALRAQVLAFGHSGVRVELVEFLASLIAKNVIAEIPEKGSVGASGDLAPLAHLGLVIIGEGRARIGDDGPFRPSAEVLRDVGLSPMTLDAKEGLALINGTQVIAAIGGLALVEAETLVRVADIAGAMSLEALKGTARPFDDRIQAVRAHPGQRASASNLRALLTTSEIAESHRDCGKVQDPYSLRCMPQVHGATRDVLAFARSVVEIEICSVTDNPLIFTGSGPGGETEVISGGNFHGQPLALALDAATLAVAELANISERRIEQLVNPAMSSGLPPFLAPSSGLDSGFMIAQVTAAALVSENKVLAHPSSVDSIPSSAGKEDHVSMGTISARKLAQVTEHVRHVLAIEAIAAAQGIDLRRPLRSSRGVEAAHAAIRERVPTLAGDRVLHHDILAASELVRSGELLRAVERATEPLL